ncbi:DUF1826 domain-containing protein [Pseudomonas capeferrum]|uniref:DUF1826 domain-containing protein n=1 Tax=Pseudomonas capeferrum TaxID=1495066 RepID=UPI00280B2F80|nr:DUF1826 domain-containing protein [Pseudomonas capeferrum]
MAAYTCLLGAYRVGLRLRVLEGAMCPRFHVDQVPFAPVDNLYRAGKRVAARDCVDRSPPRLTTVPVDNIKKLQLGEVALLKGERWIGNEGRGLVHRSPEGTRNRRLLLSLDWLA